MKRTAAAMAFAMPLLAIPCRAGTLLSEATGAVSQTLCSKVFVSGLSPDEVYREHLLPEPGMALADWLLRYEVDRERREVRSRLAGTFKRRSAYSEGRGCTLAYDAYARPEAIQIRKAVSALLPQIAGPELVTAGDAALRDAVDAAFSGPVGSGTPSAAKAVVVVHDGQVVAERYAPGYGIDTPVLSHSIAKSVVNAMIGILVRRGGIAVSDAAPVAAWRNAQDPHAGITIDQLLRMTAGFGFDEGGGASIASDIWYNEPDTARASQAASIASEPGTAWGYSSRSYVILSRIIGDAAGRDPQSLRDFAQRELFDPLGMTHVTLEFDAAGTMMGAHAMFATPRDWARLGLLYLFDGVVGGVRILPEGWVRYSTSPSSGTGYGAGFWLNTSSERIPQWGINWGLPGAPRDAFMARGYLGQFVVIVPSENLVVARFGVSHSPVADAESTGRLVRDVIASLGKRQAESR